MSELITLTVVNGVPTTTSLAIAERFGKLHKDVLRALDNLECSNEFIERNFALNAYKDSIGRLLPMYNITKDGFVFLAMGFTGKEAAAWKERFIAAFNALEAQLLARMAADQIPKSDGQLFLSHRADIMVAADRTFRAAIRSGRLAGLNLPQCVRRANQVALDKTGLDMLATLRAEDHVAELEASLDASAPNWRHADPGNEERFLADWQALRLHGPSGSVLPFCPCSGSRLYQAYERWCAATGERARRAQALIGTASQKPGWQAGNPANTWASPQDASSKKRRMVVPGAFDMGQSTKRCQTGQQHRLQRERFPSIGQWLGAGFYAFECAMDTMELVAD